jgi:hypothetical protein
MQMLPGGFAAALIDEPLVAFIVGQIGDGDRILDRPTFVT